MSNIPENQVEEWLKKLERESWQLELLVSAFTIFLLIGANSAYSEYLAGLNFRYNMSGTALSITSIFLIIIKHSILALTISLIIHLMLRGFWIGTIGLRSVQSSIDFAKLNYTEFFTEKLKKKVMSLDRMVVKLDEICSVIFAFSFLIISILIAFGTYLGFIGIIGAGLNTLFSILPESLSTIRIVITLTIVFILLIMGLIFMLDYFTLGFFKKIKWFGKIYYPFYRLFNFITLSGLSRSIYYYLISKFTKKKIRILYVLMGLLALTLFLFDFDQHQYYPQSNSDLIASSNVYDDQRLADSYVEKISIPSNFIDKPFFPLFIRYDASDNGLIKSQCPDFIPMRDDGLNFRIEATSTNGGFLISRRDYSDEDFEQLRSCLAAIYYVEVNDSAYSELTYRFYLHPAKQQKGLLTVIPTDAFILGENVLRISKLSVNNEGEVVYSDFVQIPFWYNPD